MKKELTIRDIGQPDRMISYWKAEWKAALVIFITGMVYNGAMGLGPVLQGKVIDLIAAGEERQVIIRAIALFLGVICVIQFSRYLKRYYVRIFANRTSGNMRMLVYRSIVRRKGAELKDENAGDLMTRAISDVGECVEGMRKFTTEIFDTGVLMAAYLIMLLSYDVKLTAAAVFCIPVAMFIAERMKTVIYKYSKSYRNQLSRISSVTLENIENELIFRLNGVEEFKNQAYDRELEDLRKKAIRANVLENSMQPVYKAVGLMGIVLVVFYGGQKVFADQWTIGTFSAYITIFSAFSVKASKAAKLFNSVQKAQVSWQRIKPYLAEAGAIKASGDASDLETEIEKEISLSVENLSMGIIEQADFSIETGQLIGVTGPVAGGKSTIGRALQGFYPYEGSIRINGRELRNMEEGEVSRYISYMGHDSQLLFDTIYNNITLGRDGDITEVLKDVCFDVDLASMPDGIHTKVGASGVRLSGGQQARLALARALYNKSRILVLDDPFAAVDVETEKQILDNLRQNYSDCAVLLISHRISAFDQTEGVLLVKDGKTTFDTHENLLKISETYQEIFRSQQEGGLHV